jgi:hypothetical protein
MDTVRRITRFAMMILWVIGATGVRSAAQDVVAIDEHLTPSIGAVDVLSLQSALRTTEDRFLPLKIGTEQSRLGLAAGIAYRAGKLLLVDVPQDHMLLVVQHEVFGHGARMRELGSGHIGYGFDAPIPYGAGGGVTTFEGELPDSPLALLTIESAGVEAQHVLADAIAERAIARGRINYREAWLYFESRYVALTYILDATQFSREGNDIADFAKTMKDACAPPACDPIGLGELQDRAKIMLADPMLYLALYGFASSYIGLGEPTSAIPMIPMGRAVQYLPSLGFQMTPYGTEWSLRNALVFGSREKGASKFLGITMRIADTGATTPWGVDVRVNEVRIGRAGWRFSPTINLWRQPPILAQHTSDPLKMGIGVSASTTVPLPSRFRTRWIPGIYIIAGGKSEGFVPGEQLSGGLILKAGLTVRMPVQ